MPRNLGKNTQVKICRGEPVRKKERKDIDKDRYRIHGFYKKISVVNCPNTRCISAVSRRLGYGGWFHFSVASASFEFWLTTRVRLCFFPQASIFIQRRVYEGFKLQLYTSD
ncbi:unnamed protein product [Eruca vesicaria subsp. sativa]|uniref:Uncharacterized protein n=1 Tax=Eruca vesicaria subsp. sativa TaxID=29727 RepID=A0ABC8LSJ3_ERUVS|nr:unnamed protein product [Eruca vesicaria subsp. sativa]